MKWIALHTFRTLIREKILFNIFGITIMFFFFGYLASQLVYGHQDRVMLDVGLALNALSIFAVSVGIGARFFRQDIENKTIHLMLSRGMGRIQFYGARFLGMWFLVSLNLLVLSLILAGAVVALGGSVSSAFFQSMILTNLEAGILLGLSLLLSFGLRPALVWMISVFVVFLGHNSEMLPRSLSALTAVIPNFRFLLMSERVYYADALTPIQFGYGILYGMIWLFFFLLLGNAVFSKKNL